MKTISETYDSIIERRKTPRCEFLARVDYNIEGKKKLDYSQLFTMNISRDGILLFGYSEVCTGDRINVVFKAPFYSYREISISGVVVRIVTRTRSYLKHIGIRFDRSIFQDRIKHFVEDVNKGYYCS